MNTDSDDSQKMGSFIIQANVNKSIADILGIQRTTPEIDNDNDNANTNEISYDQPKEPGLSNCNVIIPNYYGIHSSYNKMFDIDYYVMIKDDIKNLRPLNKYQLDFIKTLPHEDKYEIIEIFNACVNEYIYSLGYY